jgi:hypothetical protein
VHKPAPSRPTDHAKDNPRRRSHFGSDPPGTGAHILTVSLGSWMAFPHDHRPW